MALKIIKRDEPIEVKQIVSTIYGAPGIGKTSTAFTAEKPLLLDFDAGAYRSANRQDCVQPQMWDDVLNITADDLKPFKTVVVDTVGRALDMLTAYIVEQDPKMKQRGGELTLKGYGRLKDIKATA